MWDIWRGLGIYYPICMYQENRTRYYISGDSERKVFEENIVDKRVLISLTQIETLLSIFAYVGQATKSNRMCI